VIPRIVENRIISPKASQRKQTPGSVLFSTALGMTGSMLIAMAKNHFRSWRNPEGILSSSEGLAHRAYPGKTPLIPSTPKWVVSTFGR
jgi:hypothetical protein